MSDVSGIGEDALIDRLIKLVPHASSAGGGPGDDCAVIDQGAAFPALQLLKTDALVEGIHFLTEASPRAVGWKSVARVMSDFAAMGGKPEHFLVTLALPKNTAVTWVEEVYRGIGDCLEAFGGLLAGGETSSVPTGSAIVISIAATGSVAPEQLVLRSTASAGEVLFVTGKLGGSIRGKHLDFTPRLIEADWLVRNFKPAAMIDLSDGLAKDLPRLAAASMCGFRIDASALPVNAGCTIESALGDGEDFELLFSISASEADKLRAAWAVRFPELDLTEIGELTAAGEGMELAGGWDHFNCLGNTGGER